MLTHLTGIVILKLSTFIYLLSQLTGRRPGSLERTISSWDRDVPRRVYEAGIIHRHFSRRETHFFLKVSSCCLRLSVVLSDCDIRCLTEAPSAN